MNQRFVRYVGNALKLLLVVGLFIRIGGQISQIVRGVSGEGQNSGAQNTRNSPASEKRYGLLARASGISGKVTHGAKPVGGASIILEGTDRRLTRSGGDGFFFFSALPAGDYALYAVSEGDLASERVGIFTLTPGEVLKDLHLELTGGYELRGIVVDAEDGSPVSGALVSAASSRRGVSGPDGAFTLRGLPLASVPLSVSANGYAAAALKTSAPSSSLRISLRKGVPVHGKVTSGGIPVAGARIEARGYSEEIHGEQGTVIAVTKNDGSYDGFVAPGEFRLTAVGRIDGRTAFSPMTLFRIGEAAQIDLAFPDAGAGTIAGKIRHADGTEASGCLAEVFDAGAGMALLTSAESGRHGEFWLGNLPVSEPLSIRVRCREGRADSDGIFLTEHVEESLQFTLGTFSVAGRAEDASGAPISGAAIDVIPGSACRGGRGDIWKTGADGKFEIQGLPEGPYSITAHFHGSEAFLSNVQAGTRDARLVFSDSGIEGTAADASGRPLKEFTISAIPEEDGRSLPAKRFTTSNGSFAVPLIPGRYTIVLSSPGLGSRFYEGIQVPLRTKIRLSLSLLPVRSLSGKVVDESSGLPISGALVATDVRLLTAIGRASPVSRGASAVTDNRGVFRLTGVPEEGGTHLFAKAEGFSVRTVRNEEGGDLADIVIGLRAASESRKTGQEEIVGIGVSLFRRDGELRIGALVDFGPAMEAGLKKGDVILSIDGRDVSGWSVRDAVDAIRGAAGTHVRLRFERRGNISEALVRRMTIRL